MIQNSPNLQQLGLAHNYWLNSFDLSNALGDHSSLTNINLIGLDKIDDSVVAEFFFRNHHLHHL